MLDYYTSLAPKEKASSSELNLTDKQKVEALQMENRLLRGEIASLKLQLNMLKEVANFSAK